MPGVCVPSRELPVGSVMRGGAATQLHFFIVVLCPGVSSLDFTKSFLSLKFVKNDLEIF